MHIIKLIFGFVFVSALLSGTICDAQNKPLRALAEKRGVYIGTAVAMSPLDEEPLYRQIIEREFDILGAENACLRSCRQFLSCRTCLQSHLDLGFYR